jgi:replicative DNA helicase
VTANITEAEKRVLSALLAKNEIFEPVAELLRSEDFSVQEHQLTFTGLGILRQGRQPLNRHTLAEQLRGHRDKVTDDFLQDLTSAVRANDAEALADARIVLREAQRRRLVGFGTNLMLKANSPPEEDESAGEHLDGIITDAELGLAEIAQRQERKPERFFGDIAQDMLNRIGRRETNALMTGFKAIDDYFIGFRPGHLDVLAARYSRGKTALATCIALNLLKAGHAVLYTTLEMTYDDEMVERFVACEAGVNLLAASKYGYDPGDEVKARQAAGRIGKMPLKIRYRPLLTPRLLEVECRRVQQELGQPLRLVVVDYLGLMRGDRRENQRWLEIGNVVVALKALAGKLGLTILLLAQINREGGKEKGNKDEDYPPTLNQLRDTGTLEEHGDACMVLWRRPKLEQDNPLWITTQLILRKQRRGPHDVECDLQFREGWGRFRDPVWYDAEYQQEYRN